MKKLILALFLCAPVYAEGPLFEHKDGLVDQEFENIYNDNRHVFDKTIPVINATLINTSTFTASSATITNLSVTNLTTSAALGKFKQIVSSATLNSFSTTSTSFQDAGIKISITPSATTSKVLCMATFTCRTSDVTGDFCLGTLAADGANLGGSNGFIIAIPGGVGAFSSPYHISYLDSPVTTSAITYGVYIRTTSAGATITINNNSTMASIICAEIGV